MEDEKQSEELLENEDQALQMIKDDEHEKALQKLKPNLTGLIKTLDEVETEVWKRSSPVYSSSASQNTSLISKLVSNEYIQTDPIIDSRIMVSLGVQTDITDIDTRSSSSSSDEEYKKKIEENDIVIVKRKIPDYHHLSNNRKLRNCLNLSALDDDRIDTPTYPKRNAVPIP